MEVKMERRLRTEESSIQKFWFLDDIRDSLRRYSVTENLESCPVLKRTNYKHHAEIHDITIWEDGAEKSMLKLFEKFSLIVITEDRKLKIFLTSKDKSVDGSYNIEGYLNDFKKFLKNNVQFVQGSFDAIVFYD